MNKEEIIRKELRLIIRELGLLSHNCLNSGLTLAQAHILSYLKQNGNTPFNELLVQLGIDKASLSRTVSNLESKGFIKVEKSKTDKRMKDIDILPLGKENIINGDGEVNKVINEILEYGDEETVSNIVKSFNEFRILSLKSNLIKNESRIKIERVSLNYMEDAIKLAIGVFTKEQNIPANLVPLEKNLEPIWWCARVGEDIVGVTAGWIENNEWHWGRYAVDKRLRGIGIGKKLAVFSLNDIFNNGAEEIYSEARDITVKLLKNFGCEIIGEPVNFYGDSVTPTIIKKSDFIQAIT
ncbi:GNAT family N-acetyltransferase [Clostridium chromiireducens]|uniref:GNAT family N-acetyltransferase n=1 Tax=Clostridium chromiireducens TaxID=225345 RepID=A0A399ISB3_9CLOT|nr:bifunctional helix-turn-helix transcriptional regulator/GNAT family N-acetyltransferase [Clostridium chromiireducens]RII35830.1 GNAT family N-acetyltransferase [Clostridium chromiireducens]